MGMNEQQQVRDLLAQFNDARANNEMPLGIDIIEQMRGKNGGYPRFLYKDGQPAVAVNNKQQEDALSALGYGRHYRHQAYPTTLYRRNQATYRQRIADSKEFEELPKFPDFTETIIARDEKHEESLMLARVPKDCTPWVKSPADLPSIDEGPGESPEATIARLRGQLEALTAGGDSLPVPDGALTKHERRARRGQ